MRQRTAQINGYTLRLDQSRDIVTIMLSCPFINCSSLNLRKTYYYSWHIVGMKLATTLKRDLPVTVSSHGTAGDRRRRPDSVSTVLPPNGRIPYISSKCKYVVGYEVPNVYVIFCAT
ncbi:hypothetical protein M514_06390 [Trichuris suis]|uniref:Uncharacterized protein n=1 Tax=Trichuris suis TaxID=68888 RepID=A0A085NPX4_9BILA|nr:hypothetical protein M513_06390 [Trichuris suis]KFD71520.1 hypothetical protein M514_06390 [Trichuris suis]